MRVEGDSARVNATAAGFFLLSIVCAITTAVAWLDLSGLAPGTIEHTEGVVKLFGIGLFTLMFFIGSIVTNHLCDIKWKLEDLEQESTDA